MSCGCCKGSRTNERCRAHPNNQLNLFCGHKECMEPLCDSCIDDHKGIHTKMSIGPPQIIDMIDLENHCEHSVKRELAQFSKGKKYPHKPAEAMNRCIDKFFHGSSMRREKQLKGLEQKIKKDFNAHLLLQMVEDNHEYSLPENFKSRYFDFLDQLIEQVAHKNRPS